jgi:hypothetical protein
MMDYRVTMSFMHPNKDYMCEDTYESLVWNETEPKPTDEELKDYWDTIKHEYLKDIMRQERNQLLKDCDHCALPDFSNRENYILYRQELRELPNNWTIDTPFPQKPA